MYIYIIKFRYPGCSTFSSLEDTSREGVVSQFKRLGIKPHTLAEFFIIRSWCGGALFLSSKEFEKYIVK